MQQTTTLIVGASLSGLATAACLQRAGIDHLIIEKEAQVAAPWRNHYERLHLHTNKRFSNLPYRKFARRVPRYPSRQQVLDYVGEYQAAFHIEPIFHCEARSIRRADEGWITETPNGPFYSHYLVMATGAFGKPKPVTFRGMETFPGRILHSHAYKTGQEFSGQRVLVVGFGNSACEIALDLYERGAIPAMSVRSPVNVVPRDVFGVPVLALSLLLNRLPARLADSISAPLMRLLVGDLARLGLRQMPYGPLEQIRKDGKAPVLDIGTLRHIRKGHITLYGDIDHIEGRTIHFSDGRAAAFDSLVAAIGYYRDYAEIVKVDERRFGDLRRPLDKQEYFGGDNLYFCGYWVSPTGQIREIARDAKKIAADISRKAAFSSR
ncbi:MAG: NAD(P)/FAD-dependent oxidoreductase [Bacteroidota bacterium]|nr:NAD(P)/FAD-dependent oxidoreductase [Bacteroidota bacterium]